MTTDQQLAKAYVDGLELDAVRVIGQGDRDEPVRIAAGLRPPTNLKSVRAVRWFLDDASALRVARITVASLVAAGAKVGTSRWFMRPAAIVADMLDETARSGGTPYLTGAQLDDVAYLTVNGVNARFARMQAAGEMHELNAKYRAQRLDHENKLIANAYGATPGVRDAFPHYSLWLHYQKKIILRGMGAKARSDLASQHSVDGFLADPHLTTQKNCRPPSRT